MEIRTRWVKYVQKARAAASFMKSGEGCSVGDKGVRVRGEGVRVRGEWGRWLTGSRLMDCGLYLKYRISGLVI